jgi:glucose/arabinose dehydrogenase
MKRTLLVLSAMILCACLAACAVGPAAPTSAPTAPATLAPSLTPTTLRLPTSAPTTAPSRTPAPAPSGAPSPSPTQPGLFAPRVETVVTGLVVPWALAFAPDGRLFITERPGRIRLVVNGELRPAPVVTLPVAAVGEGGLLGLALDPAFAQNNYLYVMYTYRAGLTMLNRISRLTLQGETAGDERVLLEGIPGASNHNGGRLKFGPDGKLYATTGDAGQRDLAQQIDSLAGKILRLNPDGSVPADNPFPGSPVYSLGHRNPQGLAWQPGTDQLYSVEHGPSGEFGLCCLDEFNRIQPGGNYGWPVVTGAPGDPRFIDPLLHSGSNATWAPGGAAFYTGDHLGPWRGNLFFGALRGSHLHRVVLGGPLGDQIVSDEALFLGEYGRIRDVVDGPDGYLYLTTSNRDGRGNPAANDDRVLRITRSD